MTGIQSSLFDQDRDGKTYERAKDYARLNAQHKRVYYAMQVDSWLTLARIAAMTGDPEASISARLRDFRKARFGGHQVRRRRVAGGGLWEYKLIWNPEVPRPQKTQETETWEGLDGGR